MAALDVTLNNDGTNIQVTGNVGIIGLPITENIKTLTIMPSSDTSIFVTCQGASLGVSRQIMPSLVAEDMDTIVAVPNVNLTSIGGSFLSMSIFRNSVEEDGVCSLEIKEHTLAEQCIRVLANKIYDTGGVGLASSVVDYGGGAGQASGSVVDYDRAMGNFTLREEDDKNPILERELAERVQREVRKLETPAIVDHSDVVSIGQGRDIALNAVEGRHTYPVSGSEPFGIYVTGDERMQIHIWCEGATIHTVASSENFPSPVTEELGGMAADLRFTAVRAGILSMMIVKDVVDADGVCHLDMVKIPQDA